VILVVAADDGVKPQTLESIRYIKEAKVPYIVAINKIDLPNVRLERVKGQLAEHDVLINEFGGDVECVEISAKSGLGVDKLLENISVISELLELESKTSKPMEALVLEAYKDNGKGIIADVIVTSGILKLKQDVEVYGSENIGRIKILINEYGKQMNEVLPGCPAQLVGLKEVPSVGSIVQEFGSKENQLTKKEEKKQDPFAMLDDLLDEKEKIKIILKADVFGTLEAIEQNLDFEVVQLLSKAVGEVTDDDLQLAKTSGATIIAFQVKISGRITGQAKKMKVKLLSYKIIYELIEDLQKRMLKILEPTIDEIVTGEAEILQIFEMKRKLIAGLKVKTGELKKNDLYHLKRNDEIIANPVVNSMMHEKQEVLILSTKAEGGLTFKNRKLDFQVGDILVAYKKED
jgi:translation initiation factor IF-2